MHASLNGHVNIVEMLLPLLHVLPSQYGKPLIDASDCNGSTALMSAVRGVHTTRMDVITMLLNWGANIDEVDNAGMTALMWASKHNLIEIAELLCDRGASLEITDNSGRTTALDYARLYGSVAMRNMLKARGAV